MEEVPQIDFLAEIKSELAGARESIQRELDRGGSNNWFDCFLGKSFAVLGFYELAKIRGKVSNEHWDANAEALKDEIEKRRLEANPKGLDTPDDKVKKVEVIPEDQEKLLEMLNIFKEPVIDN